ncbi:MAG: hypothetical protein R3224_03435 [Balneolaceae bacterium]|nr:hypothetical protein [Balneolaceae bacterium]
MRALQNNRDREKRKTPAGIAARIISDVANPLFIPPIIFALVGKFYHIAVEEMSWMIVLSLLFYTIIPLSITFYLLKTGKIETLDLPDRKSRNPLFIYSVMSSTVGSMILGVYFYFIHPFLAMVAAVFFLNPVFGYFINLKWKISMHTASIASGGAILFALFYLTSQFYISAAGIFSLIMLLILLPLMMWARYYLNIHSFAEIAGGACAGLVLTLLELGIMIRFW